jgi:hypothetical protein
LYKSATLLLSEHVKEQAGLAQYDIFLSHAYDDKDLVLGVALTIEDLGYTVYIDWREDPSLDRSNVTPQTAEKLRARLRASKCLFYSTTESAADSKWMPWELGFKDGHNARTAILPLVYYRADSYHGQQYLGIYPFVSEGVDNLGVQRLWICRSGTCYVSLAGWLGGTDPYERE